MLERRTAVVLLAAAGLLPGAPAPAVADEGAIAAGAVPVVETVEVQASTWDDAGWLATPGLDLTRALYRLPNLVQAAGLYPEAPSVGINGASPLDATYLLDGLDNNENLLGGQKLAVPAGFTRELAVLSNNYSTEFGRTGNGVVNVITRSGGNELAGEAFYLIRPGPATDADPAFAGRGSAGERVEAGLERHQAGVALGGPLRRDRTFWFADVELTQDDKHNLLDVPQLGVNEAVPGGNELGHYSGKLDHRFGDALSTSLRANVGRVGLGRRGGGLEGGVTFPSAGTVEDRDSALFAATNVWGGESFISETNLQHGRLRSSSTPAAGDRSPRVTVLDEQELPVAILGHPGFTSSSREETWEAQQKMTFLVGDRHTVKAGAELLSSGFTLAGAGNVDGSYTVKLTAAQLEELRRRDLGAGLGIGDLPAGAQVLYYEVELEPRWLSDRRELASLYVEDLFSIGSRLNLTFGLRYDYDSLSKGGADQGDTDNLSPRVNFTWQVGEKSSIRGGYGVFHDKIRFAVYSDALLQSSVSPGFRSQVERLIALGILPAATDLSRVLFDGTLAGSTWGGGYLTGPLPDPSQPDTLVRDELRILSPDGYDNPSTRQASLGYQVQLASDLLFYADLLDARGYDLFRLRDLNAPAPHPIDPEDVVVRTPEEADATRPAGVVPGGARRILVSETGGRSRYQALSLNLLKDRIGGRCSYRLSYTLSRLENDTEGLDFRAQDANDFGAEWGPSANDRRHLINAVASYHPTPDLAISLTALVASGQPINRIPDARLDGTTDLNGDGRPLGDAYAGITDRQPGASRNGDRLPWSETFDLGLQYRPPFLERRLELRADVFNLLDAVNLSGYGGHATQTNQVQVGPAGSGIVRRNAGPPRQLQLGVRFEF